MTSRLVLIAALAGFAAANAAPPAPATASKPKAAKAKTQKSAKGAAANAATASLQRAIDSLARLDLLRRTDSARVADSVQQAADFARRQDSLARSEKTWFVARPIGETADSVFAARLQERLHLALRRTGRVIAILEPDSAPASWEARWSAARAAGASRVLLPSVRVGAGGAIAEAWVSSTRDGSRFDSARVQGAVGVHPAHLARDLVSQLLPSVSDSLCRVATTVQAKRRWSIALAPVPGPDSAVLLAVTAGLADGFRQSGRATWIDPASANPPADTAVVDSAARATRDSLALLAAIANAPERVLRPVLRRAADSSWVLSVRVTNAAGDTAFDSLLVTDREASHLAARAVPELLPAPEACAALCGVPSTRAVWAAAVRSDSLRRPAAATLGNLLASGLRARTDRQFLSIPDSLPDSAFAVVAKRAVSQGATRLVRARLSGSDSLWTLSVILSDLSSAHHDTLALRRGGPARRVLPWMARTLASWGAVASPCSTACRRDSLRQSAWRWGVVAPPATDSHPDPTALQLARAFPRGARGDTLAALPGCQEPACLDSLAAARGFERLAWIQRWRVGDTAWALRVRASDVVTDMMTDSVTLTGAPADPANLSRSALGVWARLLRERPCDSCVARDTLEDALLVEAPRWDSATDSARARFRQAALRVLAKSPAYQVLDTARTPARLSDTLDAGARAAALCRTGAVYRLRTQVFREKKGWRVTAAIEEIASGRVVASVEQRDGSGRASRPPELATWAVRRLLGLETLEKAPDAARSREIRKVLKLGIPAAIGIGAVILNW